MNRAFITAVSILSGFFGNQNQELSIPATTPVVIEKQANENLEVLEVKEEESLKSIEVELVKKIEEKKTEKIDNDLEVSDETDLSLTQKNESLEEKNTLEILGKSFSNDKKENFAEISSLNQEKSFLQKVEEIETEIKEQQESLKKSSLPAPEIVKGIYMTGYTFSSTKRRTELINLIKKTELNTVVIDTQDPYGNLMFPVQDETVRQIQISKISLSREEFGEILEELQEAGIYTIARVTTFQDEGAVRAFPELNLKSIYGYKWKNFKGIGWLDMTNKQAWQIPLKKAQEASKIGFDEVQFDYIRFPSDGYIRQIAYHDLAKKRKYQVMEDFFGFLSENKEKIGVPISIDLFGATYAKYKNSEYDLSIGQRLIGAAPYFDYLSPMIYPSHYASGYAGYSNPASFPYQVVSKSLFDGHEMLQEHTTEPLSKTRPWLQAFNLGATYDYAKIRAQIKAANQNSVSGWLLWSSSNNYYQAF